MRRFLISALVVVALTVPLVAARAQNADPNANANANANASASANATATGVATDSPTSMTSSSGRSATGYGYSDPKTTTPTGHLAIRSGTRAITHHASTVAGPIATLPGFEMVGDGGSRLFVELSQTVVVDERRAHGSITYVLHGAHVTVHNNTNALVTVHFNTPVASARLVQAGHDLLFVVSLRADVSPTWKINPGKEGSSVLTIDFAKGSYLSATAP